MTLPVEVFQVRKPLYVAPLTIRDDQNRPNFNLPSTYEPPCFRNEEEQKVLGVDFATSLKQIHSQWVTNRTRSHPETKQNAEKNYVFTSWLIKWGLLSTKYKGDPFSAGRYNLWPDEMMKPYYPELHECSDSPQWDLIQEMSWDSDQIKEVISIYKKHPKEFLTRLHEAYPIPTFSTTKELVIEKINKFIEEFVRHANDPQPVVDGDNSDSNSWWITKKFNKYVYPYYEWFLGPDKNNLKNIEERTPIENQVTEWMNSELFNNLEQKNKIDMQQIEKLELNNKLQSNHIELHLNTIKEKNTDNQKLNLDLKSLKDKSLAKTKDLSQKVTLLN
jgi:hypothetical protein